jgi:hypothetical protein
MYKVGKLYKLLTLFFSQMKLLVLQNRQGEINNKIIFVIYFIQNQYFIDTIF